MASNGKPKFKVAKVTVYQVQDSDKYYGYQNQDLCEKNINLFGTETDALRRCELLNEVFENGARHGEAEYKKAERDKTTKTVVQAYDE
jgi:hypothetical protein